MITKEMTCIVCPIGCRMTVSLENGKVVEVTGNACNRGPAYAIDECTAPKRMLTTTVLINQNGKHMPVPVKTKSPIPKELLFDAMQAINAVTLDAPASRGDIVVANLLGTGIDVILTDDIR